MIMRQINFKMPEDVLMELDDLLAAKVTRPSRAQFIREALEVAMKMEKKMREVREYPEMEHWVRPEQ